MFDTVKNSLGSNWPERAPTLNIEWGQIDPKVTGGLKNPAWFERFLVEPKMVP